MIALAIVTAIALFWVAACVWSDHLSKRARVQAARDTETRLTLEWMRSLDMTAHEWEQDENGRWRRVS